MTNLETAQNMSQAEIVKGSVIGGISNAVINGGIQYFMLKGETAIPLTVNTIINDEHSVLGAAVPLAVILAMILTIIAHLTLKAPKRPFMPGGLWLTLKHGLFTFGSIVSGAIVWQAMMGSVSVSLTGAVITLSLIAGITAAVINYMTISASLLNPAK